MNRLLHKIKKRFILISEGRKLQDKIKILFWFFGIQKNLYLKNSDGKFFIRGKTADLWMMSPLGESEIRKYFYLETGSFLDIGANVGKYSIIMGKHIGNNGNIYSFEPEPKNLEALNRNLYLNKVKNVKIIPIACSNKKGNLIFYLNNDNSGGHSLIRETSNSITVKTDTLDNMVKINNIKDIKLIKIDVEGAELEVLKGAKETLMKFGPRIIFETDFPKKVLPFLMKLGYKVKKISEHDYFASRKNDLNTEKIS